MSSDTPLIIVAALDEADRIDATLAALGRAFPGASVWVADDGSTDATPALARAAGATVVRSEHVIGKGEAMTQGVEAALASVDLRTPAALRKGVARARTRARVRPDSEDVLTQRSEPTTAAEPMSPGTSSVESVPPDPIVVLCDGDLGESAAQLGALVDAVRSDRDAVAVAAFAKRVGGGFGLARGFARLAIRRRCGFDAGAPISGQRAMRARVLRDVLPFAAGFGMEIGITIDAVRAGYRIAEVELDLAHRASGRTPAGFIHRARQLLDFMRVYVARR